MPSYAYVAIHHQCESLNQFGLFDISDRSRSRTRSPKRAEANKSVSNIRPDPVGSEGKHQTAEAKQSHTPKPPVTPKPPSTPKPSKCRTPKPLTPKPQKTDEKPPREHKPQRTEEKPPREHKSKKHDSKMKGG